MSTDEKKGGASEGDALNDATRGRWRCPGNPVNKAAALRS